MPAELNNMYLASGGKLALAFGTSATKIYGSVDADTVTIAVGVTAVLDGSFNRGNDIIPFAGNAASYSIVKVNASTVKITDAAGTSVTIPVGSTGTHIQFADADRVLSGSSAGIVLGAQSVSSVAVSLASGTASAPVEAYTLSVNAPTVTEGDTGSKTMSYKLTLDKAPTSSVTINYETLDTGSAIANDDFVPAAGSVTFAAGQAVAFVSVTVLGDTIVEVPETIQLNLSGSKLVAAVQATGTIIDNETAPIDPTSYTVTAGQIVTADRQGVPVIVNVGNTGNKTVTIQSDADSADSGVIIDGNATVSVTAGAADDVISVTGNANNTIDAGGGTGSDTVNIYGSGNNTIYVGKGYDTVVGGTGNDTIVVGAGDLNALDSFDGGAGEDTVRISGDGNVADYGVGGNLVNIEHLVLDGTSVTITESGLEAAIAGGLLSIEGHSNSSVITVTSVGGPGAVIDLTGLVLSGVKELKIDGAAGVTVALSESQIAAIGMISDVPGNGALTINTTVAGYQALGTKALGVTVTITDSVQNLLAAGNSTSGVTVELGNATVAEANSALATGLTISYKLVDTAANLATAPKDVFTSATSIEASTLASAAQASAIASLLAEGGFTVTTSNLKYSVSDTADMLATFTNGLDNATKVTSITVANDAQAHAIYTVASTSATITTALDYAVKDVIGSLTHTAALDAASSVTVSDTASVDQIVALNASLAGNAGGLTKVAAGYSLSDDYSAANPNNDLTDSAAVTTAAGNVTASGTLSVAEAMAIEALQNTRTNSYALSDAIGTLLGANAGVRGSASAVAYTGGGNLNVANMNSLASLYSNAQLTAATVTVSDTVANLLTMSSAAIAAADSISISTGSVTVQQIVDLKALLGAKMPANAVSDSAAAVAAGVGVTATLALLDSASSVSVTGDATVKQITDINVALLGKTNGLTAVAAGYTLADSPENLLADATATAIVDKAGTVKVTGTVTLSQIDQIADAYTANDADATLGTQLVYSIKDNADNVLSYIVNGSGATATLANYQAGAKSISISDSAVSVSTADSLLALTKFDDAYSVDDDVSAIKNAAADTLNGALKVTVTDSATNLIGVDGITVRGSASVDKVVVSDSITNLTDSQKLTTALKADTDAIVITGQMTAANASNVNTIAAIAPTTYEVTSLYADIVDVSSAVTTMVGGASKITLSDASVDVAKFNTLDNLTGAKIVTALSDSFSNLAASNAATVIAQATSTTITSASIIAGAATVEQAATLVARGVTLSNGSDYLDVTDTAANIANLNAETYTALGNAGSVITVSDNGLLTLTVAQAKKIFDNGAANGSSYGNYVLQDTAANLAAIVDGAGGDDDVALFQFAKGVVATDAATVAQAGKLNVYETMGSVTFSVKDTASAIGTASAPQLAALNKATSIEASGTATVDQAEVIYSLTPPKTYSVTDSYMYILSTAGNRGFANSDVQSAVLNAATNVTLVGGTLSFADAQFILNFKNSGATSIFGIAPNASELARLIVGSADAINFIVTQTAANAAEAVSIAALRNNSNSIIYRISDDAAVLVGLSPAVLNGATMITATSAATAAEAVIISAATPNATNTVFDVADEASKLAALTADVLNDATKITATTAATVAEAKLLHSASASDANTVFDIRDSYANIMADSTPDGTVDASGTIGDARKVEVTDASLTVEQVSALRGVSNLPTYVYAVIDNDNAIKTAANGNAAAQAVLAGATSVVGSQGTALSFASVGATPVFGITGAKAQLDALSSELATLNRIYQVSVADLAADASFYSTLGGSQFISVKDTAANLLSGNALLASAYKIEVVGDVTPAQAAQIAALSSLDTTVYNLSAAADVLAGANSAILNGAVKITATTAATFAEAKTIEAATNSGANSYSISDTATGYPGAVGGNLSAAMNGASNITITGTAALSKANAQAIIDATNSGNTTIAFVQDAKADLLALTKGANDTITKIALAANANATVAEVTTLKGLAGTVTYALNDTAAKLAGSSLLNGATTNGTSKAIVASDRATVAEAAVLDAASPSDADTVYEIADKASSILAAAPALLARGTADVGGEGNVVRVTDTTISTSVAKQLIALDAQYNTVSGNQTSAFQIANSAGVVGSFNIEDSYANLMPAGVAETGVLGAATIKVTGTVTAAQAAALDMASSATISLAIKDSYSAVYIATAATRALATSIEVNNASILANQAVTAYTWKTGSTAEVSYNVASTAAALAAVLAGANAAAITSSSAKTVTVSGTATVDQAKYLSEVSKIAYTISDNATNIQAALDTANGNNVADREAILGAGAVNVEGLVTVDQALGKAGTEDRGLYTLGGKVTYSISDNAANIVAGLSGPDAAGISFASSLQLSSNAALKVAQASALIELPNFRGYDGQGAYAIADYFWIIQSADLGLIVGAANVRANGTSLPETLDMSMFDRAIYVNGNGGSDILFGTEYADIIDGGTGADYLTGGNGRDAFWFDLTDPGDNATSAWDKLTDFTIAASSWTRSAQNDDVAEFQAAAVGGAQADIIDLRTLGTLTIEADHAISVSNAGPNFASAVKTQLGASGDITVAVLNGMMSVSSTVPSDLNDLSKMVSVASAIAVTDGETLGFEFNRSTYVFTQDTESDSLIELLGVTGVNGLSLISGVAGETVGGDGYIVIG